MLLNPRICDSFQDDRFSHLKTHQLAIQFHDTQFIFYSISSNMVLGLQYAPNNSQSNLRWKHERYLRLLQAILTSVHMGWLFWSKNFVGMLRDMTCSLCIRRSHTVVNSSWMRKVWIEVERTSEANSSIGAQSLIPVIALFGECDQSAWYNHLNKCGPIDETSWI